MSFNRLRTACVFGKSRGPAVSVLRRTISVICPREKGGLISVDGCVQNYPLVRKTLTHLSTMVCYAFRVFE